MDWLRRARGGVEALRTTASGSGVEPDSVIAGLPANFVVNARDEFGQPVMAPGAGGSLPPLKLDVTIHKGSQRTDTADGYDWSLPFEVQPKGGELTAKRAPSTCPPPLVPHATAVLHSCL